ncbi:MAG: hypothetical protein ACYTDT_00320 [Planctomycetota bacterium]|jgi:quinol-cytochrome oxidoreductase complex cytochrome b subunit
MSDGPAKMQRSRSMSWLFGSVLMIVMLTIATLAYSLLGGEGWYWICLKFLWCE